MVVTGSHRPEGAETQYNEKREGAFWMFRTMSKGWIRRTATFVSAALVGSMALTGVASAVTPIEPRPPASGADVVSYRDV